MTDKGFGVGFDNFVCVCYAAKVDRREANTGYSRDGRG